MIVTSHRREKYRVVHSPSHTCLDETLQAPSSAGTEWERVGGAGKDRWEGALVNQEEWDWHPGSAGQSQSGLRPLLWVGIGLRQRGGVRQKAS